MYAGRTNSIVKTGGTTPTQTKEVKATSFPTVVSPDSGYALSQATVTAPDNLIAENIKKDVVIAGVTGTYAGSGGGSGQLDDRTKFWLRAIQNNGKRYDAEGQWVPFVMLKEYWPDVLQGDEYTTNPSQAASLLMTEYCCANLSLESVELPEGKGTDGITSIPKNAFYYAGQSRLVNGEPAYMTVTGGDAETYYFGDLAFGNTHLNDVPDINYYGNELSGNLFAYSTFKSCNVPEGITRIESGALNGASVNDGKITLPSTLTTLKGYTAVGGSYSRHIILVLKSTTPPTLENSSTVQGTYIDQIVVPAGTLEAYQTATNWSALADIMVEATENTEAGA